jgi:hypothetical protein
MACFTALPLSEQMTRVSPATTLFCQKQEQPCKQETYKVMQHTAQLFLASAMLFAAANIHAQPTVIGQPTNQSVSLGASASFQVSSTTTNPPILYQCLYQWRFGGSNVPLATNFSLVLTNIQVPNAGDYDVVVSDGFGSTTSQVAHLEVDPAFTKVTSGRIVTDAGSWSSCAWADYDNDGSSIFS